MSKQEKNSCLYLLCVQLECLQQTWKLASNGLRLEHGYFLVSCL